MVPPLAVTVTVEVPPLQAMAVADEKAIRAAGSVMVREVTEVHPPASVTVKE